MKKTLAMLAVGLMAAPSWGISFDWVTPLNQITDVTIIQSGRALGGHPSRFVGVDGSVDDGRDHVSDILDPEPNPLLNAGTVDVAEGDGLGDFISVFTILEIHDTDNVGTKFFDSGADFQIVGVLYGLQDQTAFDNTDDNGTPGDTGDDIDFVKVNSTGGRMELYLVPDLPIFDTPMLSGIGIDDSGLFNKLTFPGVTDGIPFVAFDLIDRANGFTDQREINVTAPTIQSHNQGGFFAEVDTDWANYDVLGKHFDTNSVNSAFEGISGADLQVDYTMNLVGGAGKLPLAFDGPQFGAIQPIPEPSTLLLLGTGLLGMVGYARRRRS